MQYLNCVETARSLYIYIYIYEGCLYVEEANVSYCEIVERVFEV